MDMTNVQACASCYCRFFFRKLSKPLPAQFLWASDEINNNSDTYWSRVMEIARLNTLTRQSKRPLYLCNATVVTSSDSSLA